MVNQIGQPAFTLTQQYTVPQIEPEDAILIPRSEWQLYMERIKTCGESSQFFASLGWFLCGVGVSSLLSAAAVPASASFSVQTDASTVAPNWPAIVAVAVFGAVGICGVVIGYVTLRYDKEKSKNDLTVRSLIVQDMQRHEKKHPASTSTRLPLSP